LDRLPFWEALREQGKQADVAGKAGLDALLSYTRMREGGPVRVSWSSGLLSN
jgi:hypothetical protein